MGKYDALFEEDTAPAPRTGKYSALFDDAPGVSIAPAQSPASFTTAQGQEINAKDYPVTGRVAAAIQGLGSTAVPGLSKVLPALESLATGKDGPTAARELEDKQQALKSAYPVMSGLGEMAGYGMGAVGGLFKGLGKAAAQIPGKFAGKRALESALTTGAGAGIVEGTKEAFGTPTQDVSLARGLEEAKSAAAAGAIGGGVLSMAGGTLASQLKKKGADVIMADLKPRKVIYQQGFKPETLSKYGLTGATLEKSAQNVEAEIEGLAGQLKAALTKNPDAGVDVDGVFIRVEQELNKNKDKYGANLDKYKNALEGYANNIGFGGGNKLDLLTANGIKRQFGRDGSFNFIDPTPERTAAQDVANMLFRETKTAIEAAAPTENIKGINQKIHELITVETALNDAVFRKSKNAPFSLTDWIIMGSGGGMAAAAGFGAQSPELALKTALGTGIAVAGKKALGSTAAGSAMIRAGNLLSKPPAALADLTRTMGGGIASQGPYFESEEEKRKRAMLGMGGIATLRNQNY